MINKIRKFGLNTRNFSALSLNTFTSAIIQVTSIPLFLSFLSVNQYATWIFTFSFAQIAGLLDFGMVAAAQNRFTFMKAREKTFEIKHNVFQMFMFQTAAIFLFNCVIFALVKFQVLNINFPLLLVFTLSLFIQSCFGILEATAQMHNQVHRGLHVSTFFRLSEHLGTILGVIFLKDSLTLIASLGLLFKLFSLLCSVPQIGYRARLKNLRIWDKHLLINQLREGFPFLLIKTTDFLVFSGILLVLEHKLDSTNFIFLASCRTFFRLSLQFTQILNHTYAYEMTRAWSLNDFNQMKYLIKRSTKVTMLFSLIFAAFYLFFGIEIFALWTREIINLSFSIMLLGALYSVICSINQSQKIKFNSVNANYNLSWILFIYSLIQLAFFAFFLDSQIIEVLFSLILLFEFLTMITITGLGQKDLKAAFKL